MRTQDYEEAVHYLENEFNAKQDYHLAMFLSQDLADAEKDKRESVLDRLKRESSDLYLEIFSTIFIRETGGYEYSKDIIPHLDLDLLLTHLQELIEKTKGMRKQRLLDLYILYSQALYHFKLQTEFSKTEILCLDPAVFTGQPKYGTLDPDVLEGYKAIDKEFVRKTMAYSKREGRGSSEVAEYLMSGSRPKDFEDVFKKVYEMALKKLLCKQPARSVLLLGFVALIDESLMECNYGRAEAVVDTILEDFKDDEIIPYYFLQIKVLNNKFREIIEFLGKEYTEEEIDEDPYLKMYLGLARISEGDIPEGCRLLKEAYVQSDRDSRYLLNYSNALFIKDPEEAMDVIRDHVEESDTPLEEPHILTLAHKSFVVDIRFSKYLLDYYEKTYLGGEKVGDKYGHYYYLILLSQYYFHKRDYRKHVSVLEDVIRKFPDLPGGSGKLAEFYSDGNIKDHLDLEKAINYAKRNADVEHVAPGYFIGVCYANAGEPKKCIETLEEFVNNNEVRLQYINAYLEISSAYFVLGEEEKGCKWATEWFDRYDCPEKNQLYEGFQIEREAQVQKDLSFMRFVSGKCRKLSRRIEPVLESLELWVTSSLFSMELEQERIETERLRKEVERLEGELHAVKEKYSKLDLSVEGNLEAFFDEIERNEEAHVALLKRMKKDLWQKSKEDVERLIPKFLKLPKDVQSFIHTSEFSLQANHEDSDFSGVILGYAKAFEVILDNKIGKSFMAKLGSVGDRAESITDHRVRKLFPWKFYRHQSIGVGQWNAFISKYRTRDIQLEDKITQEFMRRVLALGEDRVEKIRCHSEKLGPSRGRSMHERKLNYEEASRVVEDFREAINDLTEIFL